MNLRSEVYKKMVIFSFTVFLIVGIILIILSIAIGTQNIYTAVIYFGLSAVQIAFSVSLLLRIRNKTEKELGGAVMRHGWWIFSDAVAAVLIFPAPFFHIGLWTYVALACSLVWLLLGLFLIVITNRVYGIPLSV